MKLLKRYHISLSLLILMIKITGMKVVLENVNLKSNAMHRKSFENSGSKLVSYTSTHAKTYWCYSFVEDLLT